MSKDTGLLLETAFYHSPGHIYWKSPKGIYLGCNYINARTLGLKSPADIIGKTDFDLVWKENAKAFRKNDLYVLDTRKPEIMEEIALLEDRELIYLSQKLPLIDKEGRVVGIIGISIDITGQKKLEISPYNKKNINIISNIVNSLSTTEQEVARLVVLGERVKKISQKLKIAEKTVHSYRYRVFKKLGVKNNMELIHFAINYDVKQLTSF